MTDLFIADAHLRNPEDENYRKMLAFLDQWQGKVRTLYLLGDIFHFWIGRRFADFPRYQPLLDRLKSLRTAGTDIVYVEGNHDFCLAPYFADQLGCTVLPDGGEVEIDGTKVFLTHGDQVNPEDIGYHKLRRFLRGRFIRFVGRTASPDLLWHIANWGSHKSAASREGKSMRRAPRDLLFAYGEPHFAAGCRIMISGHYHQPIFEQNGDRTLIAVGDWITQYSYAVYDNGEFRLETFEG
ncbi:MAG: UDP-2,3-diacylglucosamine diphosphatase [Desulfuromonas sp.]|nr:MAG: UDP-2,3-diacylglucosamine diphosphatase [Desulfuromonas sp.]